MPAPDLRFRPTPGGYLVTSDGVSWFPYTFPPPPGCVFLRVKENGEHETSPDGRHWAPWLPPADRELNLDTARGLRVAANRSARALEREEMGRMNVREIKVALEAAVLAERNQTQAEIDANAKPPPRWDLLTEEEHEDMRRASLAMARVAR